MNYWEETWEERAESIKRAYGDTWPPETVVSFSWRDRIGFPGACALRLPPIEASRDPVRYLREDWLYLTMGLSQPLDEAQVERERAAGKKYSSYGIELGFVVADQSDWASTALYGFMTHILDEVQINWGDRFAFGFSETEGDKLGVFTGHPEDLDITPFGEIRAVAFWPYLFPDTEFTTSTGRFMVLIATGITQAEWEFAKETTTAHLMLLLSLAGIGQRTIPERSCLLKEGVWRSEIERLRKLQPDECEAQLDEGIGKWHIKNTD